MLGWPTGSAWRSSVRGRSELARSQVHFGIWLFHSTRDVWPLHAPHQNCCSKWTCGLATREQFPRSYQPAGTHALLVVLDRSTFVVHTCVMHPSHMFIWRQPELCSNCRPCQGPANFFMSVPPRFLAHGPGLFGPGYMDGSRIFFQSLLNPSLLGLFSAFLVSLEDDKPRAGLGRFFFHAIIWFASIDCLLLSTPFWLEWPRTRAQTFFLTNRPKHRVPLNICVKTHF